MSDYKDEQRRREVALAMRGRVIHVSCHIIDESGMGTGPFYKQMAGGTYYHPDQRWAKMKKLPRKVKKAIRAITRENRLHANGQWRDYPCCSA